jgi:bifunctional DNase/RNase
VKQVLINDLQDTTFYARLFLETIKDGLQHIIEIDARPSDCVILAFLHNAPVLCARQVLEKVIPFAE